MAHASFAIYLIILPLSLSVALCSELKLLNHIFNPAKYSPEVRPRINSSQSVDIKLELEIRFISSLDEISQVLHTGGFLVAEWKDDFLTWNSSDFNGIETLIVPPSKTWLPDFAIVNSAGAVYDSLFSSLFRVRVESSGLVIWIFGGNFATTCRLILTYFPFDEQKCNFTVQNWAYPASQVDLLNRTFEVALDNYIRNGEWDFSRSEVVKEYVSHDVYKNEKFPKMTFNIYLKRKAGYYMLNIVTPCCMIVSLAVLGFWLPVDSGEKVSLGITVLLGFSVFQLVIADNIPKTSDDPPLLSKYVAFIMGVSCVSTILAIFNLYLHYKATSKRPPNILRYIFFDLFARLLCVDVPAHPPIRFCRNASEVNHEDKDYPDPDTNTSNGDISLSGKSINLKDDVETEKTSPDTTTRALMDIVAHIKYLQARKREEEEEEEVRKEWQALARVIDRVCFWLALLVISGVCCSLFFGSI